MPLERISGPLSERDIEVRKKLLEHTEPFQSFNEATRYVGFVSPAGNLQSNNLRRTLPKIGLEWDPQYRVFVPMRTVSPEPIPRPRIELPKLIEVKSRDWKQYFNYDDIFIFTTLGAAAIGLTATEISIAAVIPFISAGNYDLNSIIVLIRNISVVLIMAAAPAIIRHWGWWARFIAGGLYVISLIWSFTNNILWVNNTSNNLANAQVESRRAILDQELGYDLKMSRYKDADAAVRKHDSVQDIQCHLNNDWACHLAEKETAKLIKARDAAWKDVEEASDEVKSKLNDEIKKSQSFVGNAGTYNKLLNSLYPLAPGLLWLLLSLRKRRI